MVADPLWVQHCAEVRSKLLELRSSLGNDKEAQLMFDEYLEANELELGLHVVCDFLIEREPRQIDPVEMNLIRGLHEKMNLTDNCCSQLQLLQTNA